MSASPSPWVAVLAGGDSRRMSEAIVDGRRLDRPKQFCRFRSPHSLLRLTLRRAAHISEGGRILAVVREAHRRWWHGELAELAPENILVHNENRGTAVAIVHALIAVARRDREAILVILPSDHVADRETVLVEAVNFAVQLCKEDREHAYRLGVTAESAETEYGWIVPCRRGAEYVRDVVRFVEKPTASLALELRAVGALWNSFILAGSVRALLMLIESSQPLLLRRCCDLLLTRQADASERGVSFHSLPSVDFGRDVLQPMASHLRVVAVPACGWTDLGTPGRVARWLEGRSSHQMPIVTTGGGSEISESRMPGPAGSSTGNSASHGGQHV